MMLRFVLLMLVLLSACRMPVQAQAIGVSHPETLPGTGFSARYENDAFGNTDYYYSQGVQLMATHPALKHSPVSALLLHPSADQTIYGLSLEHDAYTPTSILSDSILYGDRPYAAAVVLQSFAIATNATTHHRLTTSLSIGLVGPGAGGEEIQALIHRNTHNDIPHGWQYQIANDAIVNYSLRYERGLLDLHYLTATAQATGTAGTYQDKAAVGLDLTAGWMNRPLYGHTRRRLQAYVSEQATITGVAYDATLQGGLFNHSSSYTIAASDIRRVTFRNDFSFVVAYRSIVLAASYTMLTPEFRAGRGHAWGGFSATFGL